jgi:hypothetical protein
MQANTKQVPLFFGLRICYDTFWRYPLVSDGLFSRLLLTPATEDIKCTRISIFSISVFEQQKIRFKFLNGRTQALKSEVLTTCPSDIRVYKK